MMMRRSHAVVLMMTSLWGGSALARGQTAPVPAAAADDGAPPDQVEQIVVTARRVRERLQDTPLSITAFSSESISRSGYNSVAELAQRTPGLQYGSFRDRKLSPTSLRGVVSDADSAAADPAIGYYVDDVYYGQGVGVNLDLYDIDRVEILRGPQGTLFGRNTIGGVINLTTKKPSERFEVSAMAEAGNYDYLRGGASISGPIMTDRLLFKLTASGFERGGIADNETLRRPVDTQGQWSVRGQVLAQFGPESSLTLTGAYQRVNDRPLVFETLEYNDAALTAGLLDALGLPRNADPFDRRVQSDILTRETLNAYDLSVVFRTRIGMFNVTNILAWHHHAYFSRTDTDRSPLSLVYDGDPERMTRWSNELRVDGSEGPLNWVAGLYVFDQRSTNLSYIDLGTDLAAFLGDATLGGLRTGSDGLVKVASIAGFASATLKLGDRLDITAGGRYTRDRKKIAYAQFDPLGLLGGSFGLKGRVAYPQFTPSFSARYRFTPDALGYLTVSKGFKSGGFNDGLGSADGISFGPEKLWNYELGFKSSWLGSRLVVNAAAYLTKWSSIQITQDNPATTFYDPIITNGGAATSRGAEIEVRAVPFKGLELGANFAAQDARFDRGSLPDGRRLGFIAYAPAYTGNANASYRIPLPDGASLTVLGDIVLRGRVYLSNSNLAQSRVRPVQPIGLRATFSPSGADWSVAAWVKNLTNLTYPVRLFDQYDNPFVGQRQIILNEPRTFGVTLRVGR
jgi:iron complex outermembrane receptor protein